MIHVICDMCFNDYTIADWVQTDQLALRENDHQEWTFCTWACLGEFTLNTLRAATDQEESEPEPDPEPAIKNGRLKPVPVKQENRVKRTGDVEKDRERDYTPEDEVVIPRPQGVQIDSIKIKR